MCTNNSDTDVAITFNMTSMLPPTAQLNCYVNDGLCSRYVWMAHIESICYPVFTISLIFFRKGIFIGP